ncbi:hypothetical protein HDV57DRAFT_344508 [Trichoderma longibrachiatum]
MFPSTRMTLYTRQLLPLPCFAFFAFISTLFFFSFFPWLSYAGWSAAYQWHLVNVPHDERLFDICNLNEWVE